MMICRGYFKFVFTYFTFILDIKYHKIPTSTKTHTHSWVILHQWSGILICIHRMYNTLAVLNNIFITCIPLHKKHTRHTAFHRVILFSLSSVLFMCVMLISEKNINEHFNNNPAWCSFYFHLIQSHHRHRYVAI